MASKTQRRIDRYWQGRLRHLIRNPASGRVLQKIGMRLEGLLREAVKKWNRFEDLAVYGLLASDRGRR